MLRRSAPRRSVGALSPFCGRSGLAHAANRRFALRGSTIPACMGALKNNLDFCSSSLRWASRCSTKCFKATRCRATSLLSAPSGRQRSWLSQTSFGVFNDKYNTSLGCCIFWSQSRVRRITYSEKWYTHECISFHHLDYAFEFAPIVMTLHQVAWWSKWQRHSRSEEEESSNIVLGDCINFR